MDRQSIEQDFQRWIDEVLDVPHAALNGNSPCPFAKAAWTKQRYRLDLSHGYQLDMNIMSSISDWPEDCDLWIWVCDPDDPHQWPAADLSGMVSAINRDQLLPRGFIALEGHPQIPEAVLDCDINQGQHIYVIIQPLDKLAKHKAILEKRGYYDNWPKDMYDAIVGVRESAK